jgi:hypothetical protein
MALAAAAAVGLHVLIHIVVHAVVRGESRLARIAPGALVGIVAALAFALLPERRALAYAALVANAAASTRDVWAALRACAAAPAGRPGSDRP